MGAKIGWNSMWIHSIIGSDNTFFFIDYSWYDFVYFIWKLLLQKTFKTYTCKIGELHV
jgi:hypothetical protein